MSVALRCPACGTTQNHPGECDACYEAEVRYYCTNHTPGKWLDHPECSQCGAKFGDAPKPSPRPPERTPASSRGRSGSPPPSPPSAGIPHGPRDYDRSPPPRIPPEREFEPVKVPRAPTILDLLARIAAERAARLERTSETRRPREAAEPPGLPVKGCIMRFILLLIILGALAIGALFLVLSGSIPVLVLDPIGQVSEGIASNSKPLLESHRATERVLVPLPGDHTVSFICPSFFVAS